MESPHSVNSPRRTLSLSRQRRATVSFLDSDDKNSGFGLSDYRGPKPSEVYGFVGSITTIVATVIFLVWAYVPESWLHSIGISYYPSRYWALAVPTHVMVTIVLMLGFYIGLNFISAPSPASINTVYDYDPKMLLPFLRSSQHYTLEKAYEICINRDLMREQVFILGRMGNSKQALAVIINKLGDIEEAVEFVTMQHDDELWEELIKQCLHKPEMVGILLEHTVGNLDPLYIVNKVPNGMEIPRTETSLRHGCNDILKADCVNLLVKYYKEAKHGVYLSNEEDVPRAKRSDTHASHVFEKSPSLRTMELKSKTKGGGRCCICFDPFSIQNVSVIVFFCCHAYHTTCLMDSSYTNSSKKEIGATSQEAETYDVYNGFVDDNGDDNEETEAGRTRMRCILCTTAAS